MFAVSLFKTARDNTPRARQYDEPQLQGLLSRWLPGSSKADLMAWSPASYPAGKTRGKASVNQVSCLVFDVDDGMPFEAGRDCFGDLALSVCAHTSWSHTDSAPKWRLVFPLMRPIDALHWPRAWRWALKFWAEHAGDEWQPDTRCSDASRIFYLPAYREGQQRQAWSTTSWLLDIPWWEMPEEVAPAPLPDAPATRYVSGSQVEQETRRRLRNDPSVRRALGKALGGAVNDELVRHVRCPSCGRSDVWWAVHPGKKKTAECNHKKTCGWYGHLDGLAAALGVKP